MDFPEAERTGYVDVDGGRVWWRADGEDHHDHAAVVAVMSPVWVVALARAMRARTLWSAGASSTTRRKSRAASWAAKADRAAWAASCHAGQARSSSPVASQCRARSAGSLPSIRSRSSAAWRWSRGRSYSGMEA